MLTMNDTHLRVDLRKMKDGTSLVRFNDTSFVTHVKEDISQYRVLVGGKMCIFDKEKDPSICRSTATGMHHCHPAPPGAAMW
jgi:hypothetical protein